MNSDGAGAEREFFRSEFRHRTLAIALRADATPDDEVVAGVAATVAELIDGQSRVLLVASSHGALSAHDVSGIIGADSRRLPDSTVDLAKLWMDLNDDSVVVVATDGDPAPVAAELADRLGVTKLVLTDPAGGWGVSFGSEEDLEVVDWGREVVASAAGRALSGRVRGVNLCRIEDPRTELYTFDGAGTLFTRDAYVQVSPLCVDDLPVVENLVDRGVAGGFLRPRTRDEVVRLALGGVGARVVPSGHLAGIGALEVERYATSKLAEVSCLYTINRFTGEGVGADLVTALTDQARDRGMVGVFACTVSDRAAELFGRSGFSDVPQSRLPESKWIGYDSDRRSRLRTLWLDLFDENRTGRQDRAR